MVNISFFKKDRHRMLCPSFFCVIFYLNAYLGASFLSITLFIRQKYTDSIDVVRGKNLHVAAVLFDQIFDRLNPIAVFIFVVVRRKREIARKL